MRIGFLSAELSHNNGWAHYSTSLLQALDRRGIEMRVITARNNPPDAVPPSFAVLPTVTPPDRGTLVQMLRQMPRVRKLLADCDLIHATVEHYIPLAAALSGNRPVLATIHGSYAHLPRISRWPLNKLYEWAFRRAKLVCVSHYTEQIVQQIVPGVLTVVVNNGVDLARFADLPHWHTGRPTVISVGGVKYRKGTDKLVKAMAVVRQQIPAVQCIIIGTLTAEPHYTRHIRQLIAQLELQDCVQLAGFVDEETLLGWYGTADVFALPSQEAGWKFEGFGLVHLAASAAGLPVIGTRNCGVEDAIDHELTGLLVDPDKLDEDFPKAILRLLQNPDEAQAMGEAGKRKAQSQTWDHVAAQMIDLYQETLRGQTLNQG